MLYFAYTDWIFFFFLTAISPKECVLLITDIWYVHSLEYFLLVLYVFQKSLSEIQDLINILKAGKTQIVSSLRVVTTFWCGETATGKIDNFDFHWYG